MWPIVAIVVIAAALIVLAGRQQRPDDAAMVETVDGDGLHLDDRVVGWGSIFEVVLVTRRRVGGLWYGFEISSEDAGLLIIDGSGGLANDFLAQSYRLTGFDHGSVNSALVARVPRTTCYSA